MDEQRYTEGLTHDGEVDITGQVLQVDVAAGTFEIWPDETVKITAAFTSDQESEVVTALRQHANSLTRVLGRGHFVDGTLSRILEVDSLWTFPKKRPRDPNIPHIMDLIAEISKNIPQEELDKIPTDLSYRLDHYLYSVDI